MNNFKPDFNRLRKVLLRQGEPDYVPFYELFADVEIIEAVTGKKISHASGVEFQYKMGYDYAGAGINFIYPKKMLSTDDTAQLSRGKRNFVDDNHGMIENRSDFDAYSWPVIDESVYYGINQTVRYLPEGMKIIVSMPGGILENVMWLMGYVPFSYAIHDDEQLVWDMFEKIGNDFTRILKLSLENTDMDKIGAVVMGDDMGFNHSTMISPELLRKYVFPWQKKLVDIAHDYDLPMILHSCGNLEAIMDDLIDYVGFDAKQSFEDKIMPVTEAKKKYGNRIAILGGVDIHFLATKSEEEVRLYVDSIIESCAPGGGYALGTGNTVANYIPLNNYLAMLDEGRKKGKYPIRRG
ncbi:MAG TPA: uroporphyrinogen-III decarboxylase-like protein [Clostridiales bacterium]|nr:uroporphyrinogen-III decarboxylase-like protein [Clostridiales bacterium]